MKICKTVLARCSLEAEFNDFLGEEVIQALVQLSHDAVRLCFLWRRAARGLPLKETNRAQLFDDEFTLKGLTKQIPNIHPRVDLGMLETYVWPSGFRPLGFWPEFGVMFQSFVLHGRQLGQRGRFCILWSRGRGEVFVVRWCSVQLWRRRKRRVLDVDRYLFQSFVEVKLQLWQAKTEGSKASWEFQKDKSRSNKSNTTAAGPHAKMLCYILSHDTGYTRHETTRRQIVNLWKYSSNLCPSSLLPGWFWSASLMFDTPGLKPYKELYYILFWRVSTCLDVSLISD